MRFVGGLDAICTLAIAIGSSSMTSRLNTGSICARTNVIESSFATVRHRTVRSKGCLSNKTALAMIFKLAEAAEKSWRRLDGHSQFPKIILGERFTDGIEVVRSQAQIAAA
jgi:hypothetical protein